MERIITYSPAYTLVPTYECFNRCHYCNFRVDPNQDSWLTLEMAQEKLTYLQNQGIIEILVLSGEVHPHSPRRKAWFERIYQVCELALSKGFLPHTNVGILSFAEMEQLKQVNVSMGLMLEQLTPKLLETVHLHAPSKVPQLRLQQLEWVGELKIPFTTGLLLGIGETQTDWWETLEAIAKIQQRYRHLQEVILQPYSLGTQQSFSEPSFKLNLFPNLIAKARQILPDSITLQIPPNLITNSSILLDCLEAGARDLGGISPHDEVNPNYPHFNAKSLAAILESGGWKLVPRLPIYPQYYDWISPNLQKAIAQTLFNNSLIQSMCVR